MVVDLAAAARRQTCQMALMDTGWLSAVELGGATGIFGFKHNSTNRGIAHCRYQKDGCRVLTPEYRCASAYAAR